MPILTTAIVTFILLILIGIAVGLLFNRGGRGWFGRQVVEATGAGDVTYALVGIAGSFMGYHVGVILELLPSILLYVVAIAGAALTLVLWRGRR
ncbi:MAG: transglycosylase [Bryobacteraceae bacterium]